MLHRVPRLLACVLAAIALSLTVPPTVGAAVMTGDRPIRSTSFGIHSYQGRPLVPAGSIRTACWPSWSDVNPAPGVWDWRTADQIMTRLTSYGIGDVLFTLCGTPAWAGSPIGRPLDHWFGPGSNAPPRRMADWRAFVRAIVQLYGADIDAYQVWNEANSRFMWQGTPRQLARMTAVAARVIRRGDPSAKVVAPSVQLSHSEALGSFWRPYLRRLRAMRWPVDALSVHTYVEGREAPTIRIQRIRRARAVMAAERVPKRMELWDTETNILRDVSKQAQAAYPARAFLDSWRLGIARTYWYLFTLTADDFVGIEMRPGDVSTRAYATIVAWTRGAILRGCSTRFGVVSCRFVRAGRRFTIVYALRAAAAHRLGRPSVVCPLTAPQRCTRKRGWIGVGLVPVRVAAKG